MLLRSAGAQGAAPSRRGVIHLFPRFLVAPRPLTRAVRIVYRSQQVRGSSNPGHVSFPQEVQLREKTLEGGAICPMYFDVLELAPRVVTRTFERLTEVEQGSPHPVLIVMLSAL